MFDQLQQRSEAPTGGEFAEPAATTPLSTTLAAMAVNPLKLAGKAAGAIVDPLVHPEPYAEITKAALGQLSFVDSWFARGHAIEEAYDRRIGAVRDATGVTLPNPERGGYSLSERELRTASRDGPIDPAQYRRGQFDNAVTDLRGKHPDKLDALTFGDIGKEAEDVARGAEERYQRAMSADVNPIAAFGFGLAGGLAAGYRDPIFLGSLFLGPAGAAGKTVLARIVDSGMRQGLFNMGLTALEQPAVQQWRQQLGLRSGVEPAIENVGLSFLFGAIPGAAFRGAHELLAARPAVERVLAGHPEPGDAETAVKAVGGAMRPEEAAAVRMGEDMAAADRATVAPAAKGVPEELHQDMTAAALRHAEDPVGQPSPQSVAALADLDKAPPDLADRITEAQPRDLHEAQMAADEAIEDAGRNRDMADTQNQIASEKAARLATIDAAVERAQALKRGDVLNKIPYVNEKGELTTISDRQLENIGVRENELAMLVRSCK